MFKKLLGIAPKLETDGSYSPSTLALKLATSDTTDYKPVSYPKYQGRQSKILVICTEQKNMTMQNGKQFSTGNHPVETFLPMLHLQRAGFDFDIATPTGKPAIFEMWAFPKKDLHVKKIFDQYSAAIAQPKNLHNVDSNGLQDYAAIFIPGGHGAMLGLPEDENVDRILRWAHANNVFTISLCHGPAALLATRCNDQTFLYSGYSMAVFPDAVDEKTPMIGYLPGKMPRGLSEPLKDFGVNVKNTKSDNTVCLDRELITGASPLAANALGKLAAQTLLNALK